MLSAKSQKGKFKPNANEGKGKGAGKPQGKPQGKKQPVEDDIDDMDDIDDEDGYDDLMEEEEYDDEMDFGDDDDDENMYSPELFWKLELKPKQENVLEDSGIVTITNACFGEHVNKNSRTVVCCKTALSEESTPICVLNQGVHENERLELKFGSSATFTLEGHEPSNVYLTGYIQSELGDFPEDYDMEEDSDYLPGKGKPQEPETKKRKLEPTKAVESKKQPPKKEAPKKEAPKKEAPKKEAPKKEAPKKEAPKKEAPKKEAPKKEAPKKEAPKEEAPKEEAPKEAPKEATKTPKKATEAKTQTQTPAANNNANPDTPQSDKPLSKSQKKKLRKQQAQAQAQANADKSKEENAETSPEKSKEAANGKSESKEEPKTESDDKGKATTKKETKLSNGIVYKDLKEGTGNEIQNGQTVALYYVGQLENKAVFDKILSGPGFQYKVGSDEPIKGWNQGMKGMKVGGKRRIVIPPELAYGAEGCKSPSIPQNATVTFTIEIRELK